MNQFFYIYILSSIYFSPNIRIVLGYNDGSTDNPNKHNNSTLEQWINMVYISFISIFVSVISTHIIVYYYLKHANNSSVDIPRIEVQPNEKAIIPNPHDLPNFKAIKPYTVFLIHRAQAQFIFDEFQNEVKRTKIFTIVPKVKSLHADYMFIQIELVQESHTIVALIEYASDTNRDSRYFYILRDIFTTIFHATDSNSIDLYIKIVKAIMSSKQHNPIFADRSTTQCCSDGNHSHKVLLKFEINQPFNNHNYNTIREKIINTPIQEKVLIDHGKTMFIHFTYCSNMRTFPSKFHSLWQKYFSESPINDIVPTLGTRNVPNLQRQLVHTRDNI